MHCGTFPWVVRHPYYHTRKKVWPYLRPRCILMNFVTLIERNDEYTSSISQIAFDIDYNSSLGGNNICICLCMKSSIHVARASNMRRRYNIYKDWLPGQYVHLSPVIRFVQNTFHVLHMRRFIGAHIIESLLTEQLYFDVFAYRHETFG